MLKNIYSKLSCAYDFHPWNWTWSFLISCVLVFIRKLKDIDPHLCNITEPALSLLRSRDGGKLNISNIVHVLPTFLVMTASNLKAVPQNVCYISYVYFYKVWDVCVCVYFCVYFVISLLTIKYQIPQKICKLYVWAW